MLKSNVPAASTALPESIMTFGFIIQHTISFFGMSSPVVHLV
jgi:hypothetical protein